MNKFVAEYTQEAKNQISSLPKKERKKIIEAIATFELVGTEYKNIRNLGDGLFEIKPKGVRAYFMYDKNRQAIIIIGFVCLKKTKEAPLRYMKQARQNIINYMENVKNEKNYY